MLPPGEVPVVFVDMTREQMRVSTLRHNRARGSEDIDKSADVLKDLRPVSYRLNARPDESTLGFIAEDVPELVATGSRKTVNPMKIIAVLTRALQAQQQLIENQEQEAMHLEGRIFYLEQALLGEEGGLK